jgi:hypothetical protein
MHENAIPLKLEVQEDDIKDFSIYTPNVRVETDEKAILWENIEDQLKHKEDLDEDEILELKTHLEHRKREALVKDILSHSGIIEVDPEKLKMISENK